MQTFGEYLKRQREAKKVSLREIAHLTNITEWHLDSIEKDDYDKVPGGPYIRGYISSYAKTIGINADEVLNKFDSLQQEKNAAKEKQEVLEYTMGRTPITFLLNKRSQLLLCSAILVLLAFGVYHLFPDSEKKAYVVANFQETEDKELKATVHVESNQELETPSKDASQLETATLDALPRSEHHSSDKALLSEKHNVQHPKIPKPVSPFSEAASAEQTVEARPGYKNDIEVLKATVCSNVKDRVPRGENNSFQWSMEKIYIWNLIKCQSHLSSIRHIYYFKEQKVSDIVLDVRSPLWRTWSCKALLDKRFIGPWRVDVTSMDGKLLQRVHFEVS